MTWTSVFTMPREVCEPFNCIRALNCFLRQWTYLAQIDKVACVCVLESRRHSRHLMCVWPSEHCYTKFPKAILVLCEAAWRSSLLLQEPGRGHASYALLPYFLIFKGWRRPGRILCYPRDRVLWMVGGKKGQEVNHMFAYLCLTAAP